MFRKARQKLGGIPRIAKRAALVLAILPVLAAVAGCNIGESLVFRIMSHGLSAPAAKPAASSASNPSPNVVQTAPSPGMPQFQSEFDKHDPQIANLPDPYQDPLLKSMPGKTAADETPPYLYDPLVGHNRPRNWYWLRGRIECGEVEISVNDRPIGRYSVRIDHEITDNLRPGFNRIAFTPIPDIDSIPVRARITVVYSQQPRGEPPVLTYDTTMISDNQEAITPPPPPKFGDFNSSYNGNAPVAIAPKPVLHADVMTLFAR